MEETENKTHKQENISKIPDSFKFKNTPVVVKGAVEKKVEAVVESVILVPNNSIPSSSPNLKKKVTESEIGLLNYNGVEIQEKENQTKSGMDMFISKVMLYCFSGYVLYFLWFCCTVSLIALTHSICYTFLSVI